MLWIIGGDALARAILKQGNWSFSNTLSEQLEHVEWEGFRFYDLIFPLFLFLVGTVLPFSLAKYASDPRHAYWRVLRRTLLLVLLGLVCNGLLQFDFAELRYAGVLQRIGICYGLAALIYLWTGTTGRVITVLAILLGYWAILAFVPVPGGAAGDLTPESNLSGYLDRLLLPGRIMQEYYGYGDNEGLLSTIPAVATALLGVLAGEWLKSGRGGWTKVGGLFVAGGISLAVGLAWSEVFPIIKNLWTSSFVLVAGGWSLLLLALFYLVIDVLGWRRWAFFWTVIGMNAITIYVAPRILDFNKMATFFFGGVANLGGDWKPVVMLAAVLLCKWLFLLFLYRQRIFLRM